MKDGIEQAAITLQHTIQYYTHLEQYNARFRYYKHIFCI